MTTQQKIAILVSRHRDEIQQWNAKDPELSNLLKTDPREYWSFILKVFGLSDKWWFDNIWSI